MVMRLLYVCQTRAGPFFLGQSHDGRFHPMYNGESLGSYAHLDHAVDDLSGGHTFWPSSGIDPGRLGIPDDVDEWNRWTPG